MAADDFSLYGINKQLTGRIDSVRANNEKTVDGLLSSMTNFADDLVSFADGITGSSGSVSLNIDVPDAPTFREPPEPKVFTPSVLEFGAEPSLTNVAAMPGLSFPVAPTKDYGEAPTPVPDFTVAVPNDLPSITVPTMPDKPTLSYPDRPTLYVTNFGSFTEVAPTYDPTSAVAPLFTGNIDQYVESTDTSISQMLLSHRQMLSDRIANGGTGLPAHIETAIWNRERDRESALLRSAEEDALRQDAALGFHTPTGTAQAKLYRVQADYGDKMIAFGRDIAIKQAQLEIDNIQKALEQLIPIEQELVKYDTAARQRALEAVKFNNDAAVQIYDITSKAFLAAQESRKIGVDILKAEIQAYEAKAGVFKTLVEAEKSKVEVNKELIAQYSAELSINNLLLEAYKAEIDAAVSAGRLEELKMKIFELQISAFKAQTDAHTALLQGKTAEAQVFSERVRAYQAEMQGYSTEVDAISKQFQAHSEQYKLMQNTDRLEVEMYKIKTDANVAKQNSEINYASILNQANASYSSAIASYNSVNAQVWGASSQAHISAQQVASQIAKMNLDAVQASKSMSIDATKSASQVYAQLISSFLNQQHYAMGFTGRTGLDASYNYNEQHSFKEA